MSWHLSLVFLTGGIILVLEILGSRLVAPFYGTTVYVWSAMITVTLAALSVGYATGGWLADRKKPARMLAIGLAASGVWILILPLMREPVLLAMSGLGVQGGALASATLLLGFPLFALGTVSPLVIRLRTRKLERLGREVGNVSSISTIGSVVGAIATGFYLIPNMSITAIILGCGVSLLTLAAGVFMVDGKKGARAAAAICIVTAAGSVGWAATRPEPPRSSLRVRANTFYGEIKILDTLNPPMRIMFIDGIPNTRVALPSGEITSNYSKAFEFACYMRPGGKDALLIGLAGGGIVGYLKRYCGINTDVVDIEPLQVELAKKWFDFRPTGGVFIEDGRAFLERGEKLYDTIYMDAFSGDQSPYHLLSKEAFEAAGRRLKPGGIVALNTIGFALGERAELRRSVERTLRSAFPYVKAYWTSPARDPKENYANIVFFASKDPLDFKIPQAKWRRPLAKYFSSGPKWLEPVPAGRALTDDRNDVDLLGADAGLITRRDYIKNSAALLAY